MTFILVSAPADLAQSEAALMERVGSLAGLQKLECGPQTCHSLGHPVNRCRGQLQGREIAIGGDLLLNIPHAYQVHVCVTACGNKSDFPLLAEIFRSLKNAGLNVRYWPPRNDALAHVD